LKCLAGYHEDMDLFIASRALELFVYEATATRSIDGLLTKLTTLVLRLEDLFKDRPRAGRVFEKILKCDEVLEPLRVLASYRDFIESLVFSNPRFRPLVAYVSILLSALNSVKPVEKHVELVRPATFQIEYSERARGYGLPEEGREAFEQREFEKKPASYAKAGLLPQRGRRLRKILAIVAIVILIIVVFYIATRFALSTPYGAIGHSTSTSQGGYETTALPIYVTLPSPVSNKFFESSVLNIVKRAVYGYELPRGVEEAVWKALEWASKNIVYGEAVTGNSIRLCSDVICYTAQHPLSTLANMRGVCIDYAVLIATALLSVNITPVYILTFERPSHAAVAVAIGSTVFVLDQTPPPIELEDYFSYVVQNTTGISFTVFELGIERGYVVYRRALLNGLTESYSFDTMPSSVVTVALYKAAEKLGIAPSEEAREGLPRLEAKIIVNAPKLSTSSKSYPVWVLYTPVFHKQWVSYTADIIVKAVESEQGKGWRYMWAELSNNNLVVYLSQ